MLFACSDGGSSRSLSETGITSLPGDAGGDDDADDSNEGRPSDTDDADPDDEGPGIKFDLDPWPDGEHATDKGCRKVDLLFVIDNSGSMQSEQTSLVKSFEGFVAGIQAELASAYSYHVGVVTTDAYSGNPLACRVLGSLVTQTGGQGSSDADCMPFSSGMRYLDDSEPDLADKFACVAQVGISGNNDESQVEAAFAALSPALNAPGACNDGFIREDALLVLVFITDEDDADPKDPTSWFHILTQLKSGIEKNIVVLTLVGGDGNGCGAANALRLIEMTNSFTYGSVGDICAESYETFFTDAISVVDQACEYFTPPG